MRQVAVGRVFDPRIAADDRLQARAARRLVELDHAEYVGKVGQRQRRHAVGDRRGNRIVEAHDAVAYGILAVQPQVNKGRGGHAGYFIPIGARGERRANS